MLPTQADLPLPSGYEGAKPMEEHCVTWEPVPREANRYMVLNVVYVEQMALGLGAGLPLSVVVVSSLREGKAGTIPIDAWRITFRYVAAYRSMAIERWPGVRPKEAPTARLEVATWEIANSRWLNASVSPHVLATHQPHHFVIASSDSIFECAARLWKSKHVSEWKEVRDALRERWVSDHGVMPKHGL